MNRVSDIRKPGSSRGIERALGALQSEYVIVPKRRVRSWRLWLAAGLIIGIILALIVIARRSAQESEAEGESASYRVSF